MRKLTEKIEVPVWVLLTLIACAVVVEAWIVSRSPLLGTVAVLSTVLGYFVGRSR